MHCRLERTDGFQAFGIERVLPSEETASGFWAQLLRDGRYAQLDRDAQGATLTGRAGEDRVNALVSHAGLDRDCYRYMLFAVRGANANAKGYATVEVPAQTWAVLREEGMKDHEDCRIRKLYHRFYSEWLPGSGYDKAEGPDMEIYGADFEEIWIPVVKSQQRDAFPPDLKTAAAWHQLGCHEQRR